MFPHLSPSSPLYPDPWWPIVISPMGRLAWVPETLSHLWPDGRSQTVVLFLSFTQNPAGDQLNIHMHVPTHTVYTSGKRMGTDYWKQESYSVTSGMSVTYGALMDPSEGGPRPACVHARHSWPSKAWLVSYILCASGDKGSHPLWPDSFIVMFVTRIT